MDDRQDMGASVSPTGLGSAKAPEPYGLGPAGAIPSAGEVWLRSFCFYVQSFNARPEGAVRCADHCLAEYQKRFGDAQ